LNRLMHCQISLCLLILTCFSVFLFISCRKSVDRNTEKPVVDSLEASYPDKQDTIITNKHVGVNKPYTYHWNDSGEIPPVSIIIDDFGNVDKELLQGFLTLDKNVTFAVLPDLPQTEKTARQANLYGHEVILHVPMEAIDKNQNPGKRYLKSGINDSAIIDIINSFLDQVPNAIGINNHMGSGATSDIDIMMPVMKVLNEKDLLFLDSRTTASTKAAMAALEYSVNYTARDIFLDVPDNSSLTLNQKLRDLEKFRGRLEPVIIITHCHNASKLEAVRTFITQLKGLGIKLIPLSEAVGKFNSLI
jgi:polysaccharide deacetylase 2 family uncharacterized protein YibQ